MKAISAEISVLAPGISVCANQYLKHQLKYAYSGKDKGWTIFVRPTVLEISIFF